MGRAPCCDKANVKKGPWSPEEDAKLKEFMEKFGTGGNWIALPQKAGLKRCGKSCRLRWLNYLRPNIKHGEFSDDEDRIICSLYASIGSRWSIIAAQLPGRTDNDIKNYWNTKLKKKLMGMVPSNTLKPPQPQPPFETSLQNPSLSSYLSPLYRDYCSSYYTPNKSLTGLLDQPLSMSISPSLLSNNNSSSNYSLLQTTQDSSLLSNMQYCPAVKENYLVFGGDQASCSSSDGSCSQISHGNKKVKQEDIGGLQGYISSYGFEESQRFMLDYGSTNNGGAGNANLSTWTTATTTPTEVHHQKPNGYFGNSTDMLLQCDLEEVKQLISSSNSVYHHINSTDNSNYNSCLYYDDENKTHEGTNMYYY